MCISSTTTTRRGRGGNFGRSTRALRLAGLLIGWLSGAVGVAMAAADVVELSRGQAHAARVRAMTTACQDEAPAVAAHIEQAYSDWLERNPVIAQEALHALYFSPDAEARLAAYQALQQRLEEELRRELKADPEAFAERCNAFFDDLTAGELDYP